MRWTYKKIIDILKQLVVNLPKSKISSLPSSSLQRKRQYFGETEGAYSDQHPNDKNFSSMESSAKEFEGFLPIDQTPWNLPNDKNSSSMESSTKEFEGFKPIDQTPW